MFSRDLTNYNKLNWSITPRNRPINHQCPESQMNTSQLWALQKSRKIDFGFFFPPRFRPHTFFFCKWKPIYHVRQAAKTPDQIYADPVSPVGLYVASSYPNPPSIPPKKTIHHRNAFTSGLPSAASEAPKPTSPQYINQSLNLIKDRPEERTRREGRNQYNWKAIYLIYLPDSSSIFRAFFLSSPLSLVSYFLRRNTRWRVVSLLLLRFQ